MQLSLDNIGKRFKFHWIFRNINLEIHSNQVVSIKGPNGSGKSTLLKIISGFLSPSEGKLNFTKDGDMVSEYFDKVTYAAPYVDLIGQMTLREHLKFHSQFKSFKNSLSTDAVIQILELDKSADKQIRDFSSGMQQRVRLGLALLSESDLCILDEPSTNLDAEAFEWYRNLVMTYKMNSALVIASNESRDFIQENVSLDIRDFKS